MIKKILFAATVLVLFFVFGQSFAAVDVNQADQAGLDGIKGIGPSLSKKILAERAKGGPFKDWADLQNRVKGISNKNSARLSKEGLLVNGKVKETNL